LNEKNKIHFRPARCSGQNPGDYLQYNGYQFVQGMLFRPIIAYDQFFRALSEYLSVNFRSAFVEKLAHTLLRGV